MNFLDQDFQKSQHHRLTHRHTDRRDQTHYHTAFACGNKEKTYIFNNCLLQQ